MLPAGLTNGDNLYAGFAANIDSSRLIPGSYPPEIRDELHLCSETMGLVAISLLATRARNMFLGQLRESQRWRMKLLRGIERLPLLGMYLAMA